MAQRPFPHQSPGIIAGLDVVQHTFRLLNEAVQVTPLVSDGDTVEPGQIIAPISSDPGHPQRLTGGAQLFTAHVRHRHDNSPDDGCRCRNQSHFFGHTQNSSRLARRRQSGRDAGRRPKSPDRLYDMALIKENHMTAAGSITAAVNCVRAYAPDVPVEVEVANLNELEEALALPVDRIMLDNMSLAEMRTAAERVNGRILLEASGNVTLQTIRAIAETSVDYLSCGTLTHSVTALDISLLLD